MHHSQHAKNHLNHKLIQQILGSHELNNLSIFDHAHPKIIEINFCFPGFAPPCKKSVHYINSFLRYSQLYSPVTRLATPITGHAQPKKFWSTFNLCEFVSKCTELGYSIDLFWRYGWLKNPAIWLTENILAHIPYLRNQNFSQFGICAGTQQII